MILPEAPSVIQEVKLQLSALKKLEERAAAAARTLVRLHLRLLVSLWRMTLYARLYLPLRKAQYRPSAFEKMFA